jgi:alpha-glucosidase
VPIPWTAGEPGYGFNATGKAWLPQPDDWAPYARDAQEGVPGSTLELYKAALRLRREHDLGAGAVEWLKGYGASVVAFHNAGVTVISNLGRVPVELPVGEVLLSSETISGGVLPTDTTVWIAS